MHELDLPRKYRTIIVTGSFGLGGNRDHDIEALRRIHDHLEPGGTLILDNEVPYSGPHQWKYWLKSERASLPEPWPPPGQRTLGSGGTEYELRFRVVDMDPLSQRVTLGIQGLMWRGGHLIEEGEHVLKMTLYFTNELELMLEDAGLTDIDLRGDYADSEPTSETDFVVFIARKPG